jgi:16S rRNA processing protein RimM
VSADPTRVVLLGEICGVYGVKGWVKVLSFTEPRTNLFDYPVWQLAKAGHPAAEAVVEVEATRLAGKHLVAKLAGCDDRDDALGLIGTKIMIARSALPPCAPGEYYWADLVGLSVVTTAGAELGRVRRLIATGANDVLVLDGGDEQMIPFVQGSIVTSVDLEAGRITVDWDPSYWE